GLPLFRVWVPVIVYQLQLEPQSRMTTFHHLLRHQILDAAVSSGAESPLDLQFKVIVLPDCNDVATARTRFTLIGHALDNALFDYPSLLRHTFSAKPTPAIPSLAVKEQLPAGSLFRPCERVRRGSRNDLTPSRRLFLRGRVNREAEQQAQQHQTCSNTVEPSHFRGEWINNSETHINSLLVDVGSAHKFSCIKTEKFLLQRLLLRVQPIELQY